MFRWQRISLIVGLGAANLFVSGCSPVYVIKAGIMEMGILNARQPLNDVILDPETDESTRAKLISVLEAREYAIEILGLNVGESYTSFTHLEKDTLAMILSAATKDDFVAKTWWFPIIGRVPYKGYFNKENALRDQQKLEDEGFDTYLRPTSAFSTLGWFSDPLLSTLLNRDEVDLVETVLHEMSHNHLFVRGQVRFNESYATFVGRTGAIEFFCNQQNNPSNMDKCSQAQARWRDYQRFSVFIDEMVLELQKLYREETLSYEDKIEKRKDLFQKYLQDFKELLQPSLEEITFNGFSITPLNNATIMARMRYYHRLNDFQKLFEETGTLRMAVEYLTKEASDIIDPFDLLPKTQITKPKE